MTYYIKNNGKNYISIIIFGKKIKKGIYYPFITIEFENIEISVPNNIEKYLNGVKISVKYGDGIYKIYFNVEFNGIGIVSDGKLKRDIVLSK